MAITFVREETSTGEILRGHKSFSHNLGDRLIIAGFVFVFSFLIITAIFAIFDAPAVLITLPVIALLVAIYYRRQPAKIELDFQQGRIKGGNGRWIAIDQVEEVILVRDIQKRLRYPWRPGYRRKRRKGKSKFIYSSNWSIQLSVQGNRVVLVKHNYYSSNVNAVQLYNQIWMQEIAEEIAERFELLHIDETGKEPVIRKAGDTDKTLVQILKEQNFQQYDGELPPALREEFSVEPQEQGYLIKDLDRDIKTIVVLISVFILILVTLTWRWDYILSGLGLIGIIVLFNLNSLYVRNMVEITSNRITLRKRGIFKDAFIESMSTEKLEKIVKLSFDRKSGIELVSDQLRIPMLGKFNDRELDYLVRTISRILVTV